MPNYSEQDLTRWAQALVTEPGETVGDHHRGATRALLDVLVRERRLRMYPTRVGYRIGDSTVVAKVVEDPREPDVDPEITRLRQLLADNNIVDTVFMEGGR